MKTGIDKKLTKKLPQQLRRHPAVHSAYVFGSVALGFEQKLSDVDIAVRIDDRLTPNAIFDLRLQLSNEIEDLLGCSVDVVVLNTASLKMIHQVMKTGRMIYATDPKEETSFRIQKQKEYFDFQYIVQHDRKEIRRFFGI